MQQAEIRILYSDGKGQLKLTGYDGQEVWHSHDKQASVFNSNIRRKIIGSLEHVLNNAVYVDKHLDTVHNTSTHYIELFAAVKDGNDIYRVHITAKEMDKNAKQFEVVNARYYNIKTEGILSRPQSITAMGIRDKTPSVTVSVAELLDGVKDREGNPYVIPLKNGIIKTPHQSQPGMAGNSGVFTSISIAELLDGVKDREGNPYVTDGQLNYASGVQFSMIGQTGELIFYRTTEELEQQVRDEFPSADGFTYTDNSMEFDAAGGHVKVNFTDGVIAVDRDTASREYGYDVGNGRGASGMTEKTTNGAIITLAKNGYDRTVAHEAFHFMRQFLTRRENAEELKADQQELDEINAKAVEEGNEKTAPTEEVDEGATNFLVTNNQITGETRVAITDVTGAQPVSIAGKAYFPDSNKKLYQFVRASSPSRFSETRLKILSDDDLLSDVLGHAVYVERAAAEGKHEAGVQFIDRYAAVRDNGKLYCFKIVAEDTVRGPGRFVIQSAEYYDIFTTKEEPPTADEGVTVGRSASCECKWDLKLGSQCNALYCRKRIMTYQPLYR